MLKNGSLLDSLTTQQISPVTQTNNNEITFAKFLKNSLSEVNDTQVKAYEAMEGIATGKVDNLQEAVRTIEEAELSQEIERLTVICQIQLMDLSPHLKWFQNLKKQDSQF